MFDHITLRVGDLHKSKAFFAAVLAPLGYKMLREKADSAGFAIEDVDGKRDFWIHVGDASQQPHSFSCLGFGAPSKRAVDDFYAAGLAAGGRDNGAPGYRPEYHRGYYAAFVLDPDGHNIEAVFVDPTSPV